RRDTRLPRRGGTVGHGNPETKGPFGRVGRVLRGRRSWGAGGREGEQAGAGGGAPRAGHPLHTKTVPTVQTVQICGRGAVPGATRTNPEIHPTGERWTE